MGSVAGDDRRMKPRGKSTSSCVPIYDYFFMHFISVLINYCLTSHIKIWWLKLETIYNFSQFHGRARQLLCWSHLDAVMSLHSAGGAAGLAGQDGPTHRIGGWRWLLTGGPQSSFM